MKKRGILNKDLCALIGELGHGDVILVCDAGFAVPKETRRVELAVEKDCPSILQILGLLEEELIIEKYTLAEEIKEVNPVMLSKYRHLYDKSAIKESFVMHEQLAGDLAKIAKAVIRTGSFQPYGTIALYPAIDAAEWYKAEGVQVPQLYKDRV